MENPKNNTQDTGAANHPKPTDDIQMNIETVTPDTEKEGKPNSQEHNHRAEKSPVQNSQESATEENNDKENEEEQKPAEAEDSDDDKRDEIETESP